MLDPIAKLWDECMLERDRRAVYLFAHLEPVNLHVRWEKIPPACREKLIAGMWVIVEFGADCASALLRARREAG